MLDGERGWGGCSHTTSAMCVTVFLASLLVRMIRAAARCNICEYVCGKGFGHPVINYRSHGWFGLVRTASVAYIMHHPYYGHALFWCL